MEQAVAIGFWWVETIAKLGTAPQQRFVQPELSAELYLSGKWLTPRCGLHGVVLSQ